MKKHRLFASVLSVLLAASAAMTCYASTENYNDGAAHTVEGNVVNTDSSMTAVSAEGSGTSVTVNGSVESAGGGVSATGGGAATVGESVKADTTGASASGNSSVNVGGDVEAGGTTVYVTDNSNVSIGGSVNSTGSAGGTLSVSGGSSANVTGNVISAGDGLISASDHSTVEVGGYAQGGGMPVGASDNSSISIGGGVTTVGISVDADGNSTVTVGGDVNRTGAAAPGGFISAVNATNGSTVNITGSVTSPEAGGINAENGSDRCRSAGTAGHALVGRDGVVFGQSAGVVVAAYETAGTAVCAGQAFTDLNGRLVHGHGKDLAGYGQKDSSDEAGNDRQYDGSYESRCC